MKNLQAALIVVTTLLSLLSCGKKEPEGSYLPVKTIIGAQIKNIDTALYTLIKITYVDTARSDTSYVKREEIADLARDFINLPELTKKKYTEENIPGPTDGVSTYTYKPTHPENEEVKQVDVIIDPSLELEGPGKSQITTIIIDKLTANRDSSVEKKLLWQMDKSFQVTTIKQLPGKPEIYSSYKVSWSGVNNE